MWRVGSADNLDNLGSCNDYRPTANQQLGFYFNNDIIKAMFIKVKVKPNSKKSSVEMLKTDKFMVSVKSKAERGEANKETVALLAEHFGISENKLRLKKGARERSKIFEILP